MNSPATKYLEGISMEVESKEQYGRAPLSKDGNI